MTEITVTVTAEDIDAGLAAFIAGDHLDRSCPVQHALQRLGQRPVRVFEGSWHLPADDRQHLPATYGVALSDEVRGWISYFDAWAMNVRRAALNEDTYPAPAEDMRPQPITFVTTVPDRPVPVTQPVLA